MRRRKLICALGMVALLLLSVLIASRTRPVPQTPEPILGRNHIGSLEIVEENVPPTDLKKVRPDDLDGYIDSIYRLRPDHRFIYAVSEIHILVGGRQETATVSHVASGGWSVRLGTAEVGTLPDLPNFADGLAFVQRWAAREAAQRPAGGERRAPSSEVAALQARTWRGSYLDHLESLERVNALARKAPRDPDLMRITADNLLAIAAETLDMAEMLDPLLGRAMALLALSEALSGSPADTMALSVLASELGYANEAFERAATLPADSPWRLLLEHDAEKCLAAMGTTKEPFVALLTMKAFAAKGDAEGVANAAQMAGLAEPSALPFLAAVAGMRDFSSEPGVDRRLAAEAFRLAVETRLASREPARLNVRQWFLNLWGRVRHVPLLPRPVEARLREFDQAADRQAGRLAGPLADHASLLGALRAPMYGALFLEANYYLNGLGSIPAAAHWAAGIVDPPPGTATELKRWVEDQVALSNNAPGALARAAHDMGTFRCSGLLPASSLGWPLPVKAKVWWDPVLRRPVRGLIDAMDTRPSHLAFAGHVAGNVLWDLKRWEGWAVAAAAVAPGVLEPEQLTFVVAHLTDPVALRRIANRVDLPHRVRASALLNLQQVAPSEGPAVIAELRRIAGSVGAEESMGYTQDVVRALERSGRRQEADRALDEWLENPGPSAGISYYAMVAWKCSRLRHDGRLNEALRVIEPAIGSWKGDCLEEAALVLLGLKRPEKALEIANTEAERYPDSGGGHVFGAEALWQLDKPRDAAVRLKKALQSRWERTWSETVASAFLREFPGPDFERADRALEELRKAGVSGQELRDLALGIGDQGNHRLAFRLLSALVPTDPDKNMAMIFAFKERREFDGADAALAWLRTQLPVLTDPTIIEAYRIGADDIVWGYPGEPSSQAKSFLWILLRSAAYARAEVRTQAQRDSLLEYCRRQPAKSVYSVYPRYLLGELDERAVLPLAKEDGDLCTIGWLIGTRKVAEGKVAEAVDWFQLSMETGEQSLPPYGMSYEIMSEWIGKNKFLEDLDEAKRARSRS